MENRAVRIYVDMDDVLCETAAALSVLAREMFGREVPYPRIRDFDLHVAFGLDARQHDDLLARAHDAAFLQALLPTPGGAACLRRWLDAGRDVTIVTGRPAACHPATAAWLAGQGVGGVPVIYVDKYARRHAVPPGAPRVWTLDELRRAHFDLAIDDSPTALDVMRARPAGRTVVFDRPWNRAYPVEAPRVRRCRTWDEVAAAAEEEPDR